MKKMIVAKWCYFISYLDNTNSWVVLNYKLMSKIPGKEAGYGITWKSLGYSPINFRWLK